jgi:hypothetical protein
MKITVSPRRRTTLLVIAMAATVLTSCEQIPSDPMALQITKSELRLVICESSERPASISIEERVDRGSWSSIIESELGAISGLTSPIVLNASTADRYRTPTVEAGVELGVIVDLADGTYLTSGFTLPENGTLSEGDWLRSDNSIGQIPCAS